MARYIDIHTHGYRAADTITSISADAHGHNLPEGNNQNGWYTLGVHPWGVQQSDFESRFQVIEQAARNREIIAIGETGLDRLKSKSSLEQQKIFFERHARLASATNLPLIIHSVRSHNDIISLRKKYRKPLWLIHGFIGNEHEIEHCIKNEIAISPGLALLHHMGEEVKEHKLYKIMKSIPLHMHYLETDGVDIEIKKIYQLAARAFDIEVTKLASIIENNFEKNFLNK